MADTEYMLVPSPPKKFSYEIEDKDINWNNWMASLDPLDPNDLVTPEF
jgi:hypothetical protein